MRLIDADKLDEEIRELSVMITGKPNQITVGNEYKRSISRIIDEQPTAFDKEKVIEKLNGETEIIVNDPIFGGRYIKKNRAIEIIEEGGKERECRG